MPELPEVETIKSQLQKTIRGKRIKSVDVRLKKFVKCPLKKFKKIVPGAVVEKIKRRAKLLIINLSSGYSLIIHLKLTGQLIYNGQEGKYSHLVYHFSDGNRLIHNDLRQFGYVKLLPTNKLTDFFKKEGFGLEPLENNFTLKKFSQMLVDKKNSRLKPLLMDQKFLAGIGNLYSDEILFSAGVSPLRKAGDLTPKEIKRVYQGIKKILTLAVSRRGSSVNDYLDASGQKGGYVPLLKVYRREGQPCLKCQTKIKRLKINSRSAHFCPRCQTT